MDSSTSNPPVSLAVWRQSAARVLDIAQAIPIAEYSTDSYFSASSDAAGDEATPARCAWAL
jgi:hypothetical protein